MFGRLLLDDGQPAEAVKEYEAAAQSPYATGPVCALLIRLKAARLATAGGTGWADLERLVTEFAPKFGPGSSEPTLLLASLATTAGDPKRAVTILRAEQAFRFTARLSMLEAVLTLAFGAVATWLWGLPGLCLSTIGVLCATWWFLRRGGSGGARERPHHLLHAAHDVLATPRPLVRRRDGRLLARVIAQDEELRAIRVAGSERRGIGGEERQGESDSDR